MAASNSALQKIGRRLRVEVGVEGVGGVVVGVVIMGGRVGGSTIGAPVKLKVSNWNLFNNL